MTDSAHQFETGQLRALVSEVVNIKSEEIERQRKPRRLPGIVDSYQHDHSQLSVFSKFQEVFSLISHSFNARVGSGAAGCKYNGHKLPTNWKRDYPNCENCGKKISSLDEARPEIKPSPRRKRYWMN